MAWLLRAGHSCCGGSGRCYGSCGSRFYYRPLTSCRGSTGVSDRALFLFLRRGRNPACGRWRPARIWICGSHCTSLKVGGGPARGEHEPDEDGEHAVRSPRRSEGCETQTEARSICETFSFEASRQSHDAPSCEVHSRRSGVHGVFSGSGPIGCTCRPQFGGSCGDVGGDAETGGSKQKRSKSLERESCGLPFCQCSFRKRGGGARRVWCSAKFWRSDDRCCDEAYLDSGSSGFEQKEKDFKPRFSIRRSFISERVFFGFDRKESGCCKEIAEDDAERQSSRNLSGHRTIDGGGCHVPDSPTRIQQHLHFGERMGGTSQSHQCLQGYSPRFVGRSGNPRLSPKWPNSSGKSKGMHLADAARPKLHRQGLVDIGCRVISRRGSSNGDTSPTCPSGHIQRRTAVFSVAGSSMGGSVHGVPQRSRRLSSEASEPRKELIKQPEQPWRRRRPFPTGQSEEKGKSEAESKGFSCKGRMSSADPLACGTGGRLCSDGGVDGSKVSPPGSRAPTVKVSAVLNSMPRWILKTKGSLRGFLLSVLSMPKKSAPSTSKLDQAESYALGTWPIPVPYPEAFRSGGGGSDGWQKRLLSLEVVVLSWLHLGCPSTAPGFLQIGTKLTSMQWSVVAYLRRLSFDRNFPEFVDSALMGRSASKFENLDDVLATLSRAAFDLHGEGRGYYGTSRGRPSRFNDDWLRAGQLLEKMEGRAMLSARPIVASRLNFPGAPSFDPLPFFDAETAEIYLHPLDNALDYRKFDSAIPTVKVNGRMPEKLALYKKLADSGRLRPIPKDAVRGPFRSGLFSVIKNEQKDRLILDARPPNLLETPKTKWCSSMAAGATLVDLVMRPSCNLICSGLDLTDYFYQFVISEQRIHRNVLADRLSLADAKLVFGAEFSWEDDEVDIALSTLAMGDLCACEFAQASHLGLCVQSGIATEKNLVAFRCPLPREPLMVGIIIDDFVVLEQVLKNEVLSLPSESDKVLDETLAAYSRASLNHNEKKTFRKELQSKFWGIEIDGEAGLLRASSFRLWPLVFITCRIAWLGLATTKLLECLAGCWISILMVRRRLLCLMDVIFEPLGLDAEDRVIRLSSDLVDELLTLSVVGSLAAADLRAQHCSFIGATDASSRWMAAVRAKVSPMVVEEMARHSLKKSNWSRLLPPEKAWLRRHDLLPVEDELPGEVYDTRPLWTLLATCLEYKEQWRAPCKLGQHINILELKAFLREEREVAKKYRQCRFLCGLDSQVSLGALVKGRAASSSLNSLLRSSLCYPIGAGVFGNYMYYASATNRADGPTRDADPLPPDQDEPQWFKDIESGSYERFEAWMLEHEKGVVEKPFDLGDLDYGPAIDLRPRSAEKRKQRPKRLKRSLVEKKPDAPVAALEKDASVEEKPPIHPLLKEIPREQFLCEGELDLSKKGALDLYSGSFGVAKQMLRDGAPWVLCYEWQRSSHEDLLDDANRRRIKELLLGGAFSALSMAPICASFSAAVTPAVRTIRFPRGRPGLSKNMRKKIKEGNSHLEFTMELAVICEQLDIAFYLENPDSSWFWRQKQTEKYRDPRSEKSFRCSFCRFGTPWQKNTRIATSTRLAGLRMMCACKSPHHQLRGYSRTHKKAWTAVAEPYPRGLCRLLSAALCSKAGWCSNKKLNISACCKVGSLRVGEAKNPGPIRGQFAGGRDSLEELPGISSGTLAMEARLLQEFVDWCGRFIQTVSVSDLFDQVPSFLGVCLRCYGDLSFQRRGSLANFRHLVLSCQRWKPASRAHTFVAWDLIRRWEIQEPVTHRPPIPYGVVTAMISLWWMHQWYGWVGVTVLAFFGGGRLGEILRCRRSDLVLPSDTFEENVSACFLELQKFKSLFRQPAKVQHMKISEPSAVRLLERVYGQLDGDQPLYAGSASQYRRRWDFPIDLLQDLRLSSTNSRRATWWIRSPRL